MTDAVFDLDAVAAEATKREFRFKYAGREWTMRHLNDFDWRITRDSINGDHQAVSLAFEKSMGGEQYADFEALDLGATAVGALFDAWLKHCGLSRGKSPSSTNSSPSTAKPSKRASKARTRSASAGSSTAPSPPAV